MIRMIATATFGLEATVKREVQRLGLTDIKTQDGRVDFSGELEDIVKANLWLRSADRVLLNMGSFTALTFDELFEKTKALPWGDWLPENAEFTVTGKSVKSQLFSVPDCQAIVKKAVVEKLKLKYAVDWFPEDGPIYKIQVALLRDEATLTIDTTGAGLHKRGYREDAMAAPIKETLAAALIELSYWRKNRILVDPFCGSGTIPIEAALMAKNIAPGLKRRFVSEDWPQLPGAMWKKARAEAYAAIHADLRPEIYGYDIDPRAVALAKHNARRAGVDDCIRFEVRPLRDLTLPGAYGVVITNPPYGERLGEVQEAEALYREMGEILRDPTWSVYVIAAHEGFERLYGRNADAKRKLFNGRIKTDYYQYYGTRPPKQTEPTEGR